ncbi:MAG: ABC transporter permease [Anaerolineaceae bacterium]|nr:ABC transporter permease [Anaerolineaceae bacterium]
MVKVAFSILRSQWRVVVLMIFFFAITVFSYLLLSGYRDSAVRQFHTIDQNYLIIHETDTSAEFYGSHITSEVGKELVKIGSSQVIPYIHSATGTVGRDFQFVMGVDVDQYKLVEKYELLGGHDLKAGDPERYAMVGRILAEKDDLQVGDEISLRGRIFSVIGIFETHSFYDNDAIISLSAAQALLGWGTDISYYLVPDEGILNAGDVFMDGTVISHRGESITYSTQQLINVIDLLSMIVLIIGIGTSFALGNVIFRLATLQQYQLAILRSVGFSKRLISFSVLSQAAVIFLVGFSVGLVAALLFPLIYQLNMFDLAIKPDLGVINIFIPFLSLGCIALISISIPLLWIHHANLALLLRSE